MDAVKINDWVQIVGIFAVVASLIFVGLQLQQSEDIAYTDLSESTVTRGIELSSFISEHADVWHRACMGEELSPPERIIAGNIYFRYLQGNFNSWFRYQTTGMGALDSSFLTDAIAANIHRYPGFRRLTLSWENWANLGARMDYPYVQKYKEEIDLRISELEKEEPNPDADVMWCGTR